jgi:hypothetical protein
MGLEIVEKVYMATWGSLEKCEMFRFLRKSNFWEEEVYMSTWLLGKMIEIVEKEKI